MLKISGKRATFLQTSQDRKGFQRIALCFALFEDERHYSCCSSFSIFLFVCFSYPHLWCYWNVPAFHTCICWKQCLQQTQTSQLNLVFENLSPADWDLDFDAQLHLLLLHLSVREWSCGPQSFRSREKESSNISSDVLGNILRSIGWNS